MSSWPQKIIEVLGDHHVPLVIIGGHAVIVHGYVRATEDVDVVFLRSPESERALGEALMSINAFWIDSVIDPATGIEKTHLVDQTYISTHRLMMLGTDYGFLDLFDFVPGLPGESVEQLLNDAVTVGGRKYASLKWLRRMKQASARPQDLVDLQKLPTPPDA